MKIYEHEQPSVVLACIDLGKHSVLLGERWMRQHGMTPSPPHGALLRNPRFCTHVGTLEQPKVWELKEVPVPPGHQDFSRIVWPEEWTKTTIASPATASTTIGPPVLHRSGAGNLDLRQTGPPTGRIGIFSLFIHP
jgi:hypothetical protein